DQHPHPGIMQTVDHPQRLAGIELIAELAVGGGGVAVLAGQVAAAQQVPDHHRWAGSGGATGTEYTQTGVGERAQVVAYSEHGDVSCERVVARSVTGEGRFSRRPVFFRMRLLTSMLSARQASPSNWRIR